MTQTAPAFYLDGDGDDDAARRLHEHLCTPPANKRRCPHVFAARRVREHHGPRHRGEAVQQPPPPPKQLARGEQRGEGDQRREEGELYVPAAGRLDVSQRAP